MEPSGLSRRRPKHTEHSPICGACIPSSICASGSSSARGRVLRQGAITPWCIHRTMAPPRWLDAPPRQARTCRRTRRYGDTAPFSRPAGQKAQRASCFVMHHVEYSPHGARLFGNRSSADREILRSRHPAIRKRFAVHPLGRGIHGQDGRHGHGRREVLYPPAIAPHANLGHVAR